MRKEKILRKRSFNGGRFSAFVIVGMFLLLILFFSSSVSAQGSYVRSVPAYTYGYQTTSSFFGGFQNYPQIDSSMCNTRQDFILQVDPLGCTPSVVRSDLLSQQNVAVFCPIIATQLNPLISVNAINGLSISQQSGSFSKDVLTIGYQPAQAALGQYNPTISSPYLGNIGYATIVLRQQPNESAMPNFVQGNITANINYNIQNAFGVGNAVYYLPQLSDTDFNNNINAYSFWNGKGFLRLDGVNGNTATVSVYSGTSGAASQSTTKTKIATFPLTPGQKSPSEVFLPGFSFCSGGLNVQLQDLENPETTATLNVDSDMMQLKEGESFLDGRCKINSITKYGVNQNVKVSCSTDQGSSSFILGINPKINLTIGTETKTYSVGDYLYDYNDGKNTFSVYLGFIGNSGKTNSDKDAYIRVILMPQKTTAGGAGITLSSDEISYVAGYDQSLNGADVSSGSVAGTIVNGAKITLATITQVARAFFTGKSLDYLKYSASSTDFLGKSVKIEGYAGAYDTDLSKLPSETQTYYNNAMKDYQTLIQNYASETTPAGNSAGQQALTQAINLANSFGQKRQALQLCQQFSQYYNTVIPPQICNDPILLSSTQISQQSVLINGQTHVISFVGASEPTFDQYGVELSVRYPDGTYGQVTLQKNGIAYLGTTANSPGTATDQYIQLTGLTRDTATFITNLHAVEGTTQKIITAIKTTLSQNLKIGTTDTFGSAYSFSIQKINLQQVAKVSVIPDISYAHSNASFSFKIGIEKSAIQLSPNQTKQQIQDLNKTINQWQALQNNLNTVVSVGKAACLVTEGTLLVKNFIANLGGQGAARQAAMRNSGGWDDQCQAAVTSHSQINGKGPFTNVEDCLQQNSAAVDASVKIIADAQQNQNQNVQTLSQNLPTTTYLGEKVTDSNALSSAFITPGFGDTIYNQIKGVYSTNGQQDAIKVGTQTVKISDITSRINSSTVTLPQAEQLQIYAGLISSSDSTVSSMAKNQVQSILGQMNSNFPPASVANAEQTAQSYMTNPIAIVLSSTTGKEMSYSGSVALQGNNLGGTPGVAAGTPLALIVFNNQQYTLELTPVSGDTYRIVNVFDSSGNKLSNTDPNFLAITRNINDFKAYSAATYQHPYTNPQVQYYESGQYAGLPAIVPFDLQNGWYAAIKSNLPILGGLTSYDASGRVSSFYVCNVGQNGREENMGGDDICGQFVPGTNQPPVFTGLDPSQAQALMTKAVNAISDASKQHTAGVSKVTINGQSIPVGQPAANTPSIQCEDFMSPSDCNILFNVCDPVVCPSSRCNFGGAYPVQDVIQSGVVGSLLLCSKNFPQVKVPICISGVNAGLQSYISVLKSYQQCLQTSLTTGQTVGICSEIYSIYTCQFFWKQAIPLIDYAIPKIAGSVLGSNSGLSGGGEYLAGGSAVSNAQKSIDYFSQYYAANSYKAFQERSTQSIGNAVCQNFISMTTPNGGNLFNALITPDSPVQFYGQFDEIPYTTATNPPTSQYNVFYHIYAGTDFPAYYQVYLKGSASSFYQDTSISRVVGTGFIPAGQFTSNTTVFTAPSGYQQLCIVVNGQEQCGFKQVTTDFGINSIQQQYLSSQASQTNITSEAACVSGTPSAYSLLNPNIQAGVSNAANPAIYNEGIIRICSTNNPGQGTDPNVGTQDSRWQQVGYCDTTNIKCWLDTQSVKNVIQNQNVQNATLQTVSSQYVQALQSDGAFLNDTGFSSLISQIDSLKGQDAQIINLITPNIPKAFYNSQKAELYLRRATAYGDLAMQGYSALSSSSKLPPSNVVNPSGKQDNSQCTLNSDCQSGYCDLSSGKGICATNGTGGNNSALGAGTGSQPIAGSLNSLGVNYPVFTFSNAEYTYSNGLSSWFWCTSRCSDINNWNPENGLAGQDYSGGLQFLMQKTVQNNQGGFLHTITFGLLGNAKLSTNNVGFTPDGIFTLNAIPNDQLMQNAQPSILRYPIYFEYSISDNNWKWSSDKKNWIATPRINNPTTQSDIITQKLALLVEGLNNLNYGDGAELIFSIDTQNPLTVPGSGISSSTGTGSQSTGTGNAIGTCSDQASCQQLLGNEIIKLAQQIKQQRNIVDANVKADTNANSFECLALQLALTESNMFQCGNITSGSFVGYQQNGDPLYCQGNLNQVMANRNDESSLGIMQINTNAHTDITPTDLTNLDKNINYGLNLLVSGYSSQSKVYNCHKQADGTFVPITYSGWQAALRNYNGWNSQCTNSTTGAIIGNPTYVEDVEAQKNNVGQLFPQCA